MDFILNTFCTGAFIIILLVGLLLCCLKKTLFTAKNLQKYCGMILLLLSAHLLFFVYQAYAGQMTTIKYHGFGLALLDIAVIVYIVIRSFATNEENPQETAAPKQAPATFVQTVEKAAESVVTEEPATQPEEETPTEVVAEVAVVETEKATEEAVETTEEDAEKAVETETTTENVQDDDDDAQDEADDVQQLQDTSIEDLIFFQKVESLMAQKRLFCEEDISRDSIAMAIGTNRTYLTRSIKNATGKTFLEYITDLRTSYAATLLTTTNEPLDMIGTLVGFRSKSTYYRAFAAAFGCSPSEYRKERG